MRDTLQFAAICAVVFLAAAFILLVPARAHQAMQTAAAALGWEYPIRCCWGPANGRTGDCAMIDDKTVREGPNGYEVTLNPGDHPLVTKETVSFTVPYADAQDAPDGAYHICLVPSTLKQRCFFAGSRGF
jgi:hypothetical protein